MPNVSPTSAFGMAAMLLSAVAIAPGHADPVVDFYRGRTISVVSAGSAGAAHGTYAQLIARHIRRHIPGAPAVVIQYMPGAAGIKALNYLANASARDGSVIGLPLQDMVLAVRQGFPGVQYDPTTMHFLGGADSTRSTITVMARSGFKTLDDRDALALAFARQRIAYGFTGPPGIPADRLDALRKAFQEVVRDPEFLAEATRLNADIAPVSGEQIIEIIRQAFALPKEVVARQKSAMALPAN